jgi:CHAT domain-containing protein
MAAVYAERSVAAAKHARDLYHLPQMMAVLAEIQAGNGYSRRAEATYVQATDLVGALLRDFPHPRHKNILIGTMGRVFQGHFELALIGLQDLGRAFQILESAKARGLVDLLRGPNGAPLSTSPWDPRPAHQVAVLQRELSTEEDSSQRGRLLDRLWELEQRSFRLSPPDADSQALPAATPVSVQQLQSRLAADELVIEYVLGPTRSFALAIGRDRTAHYELKSRRELESAVESHLAAVHRKRDGRAEAKAIYQLLLQPVTMLGQSKRIVIIPDGKLNLVAFEALVDSNERYIVETRVISYAPSATVYCLLSRLTRSRTVQMAMLGVGGARYSSPRFEDIPSQVRGFGLFNPSGPPRWSAIPQSLAEVADVAASQTGKTVVLTGDNATETDLKRLSLSSFRVLHLALHSTIDEEFPDRSALVLTSGRNDEEDGLLQAREILSLYLNAELVTLSACDAGAGTIEGIAGMNSLVQAFLMAGSRSVVASIWPADDIFTAALMRRFYANLRQGFDKAEALTLAKRELLRINGPNTPPFYWAGFRLVGDSHGTVSGE